MVRLFGTKLGMTRVYTDDGTSVPVTVIQVGPCVVTQIRTPDKDGYAAVQVAYGDMKARNSTIPMIGHDARAGSAPKRHHAEFRVPADKLAEFSLGQTLTLSSLGDAKYVDIVGTSKGKGFAGVMKRYHFKGMFASHGTERKHRSPGSQSGHATNRGYCGKIKKGKRMSGQMGNERVTLRSLDIVRTDPERNLLLVKGPIPGANRGTVLVRPAVRLNRSKQRKLADAAAK
jgi:large subunit ribosomal protein L3